MDTTNDKTKVNAYDETLAQAIDLLTKKLIEMFAACGLEEKHCNELRESINSGANLITFDIKEWLSQQTEQDRYNMDKLADIISELTDFCQW